LTNDFRLESERLILRVLDGSYAEKVLDFLKRNDDFLSRWEPVKDQGFYTLDYQRKKLDSDIKLIEEGRALRLWMFKKEDILYNNVIGCIALNEIVRGCFHSCFMGYKIDQQNSNNGYMTEAVKTVVGYAFNDLKLHRIEANIMPRNAASMKVVEKCGFVNEGLSKKYLKINGRWEDHVHMVILNENMEDDQ